MTVETGPPAVIELQNLGLTYPGPPPVRALHSVHLRVNSGDYLAVVGPSGAGKSTFLNVLGLLDVPTHGQYRLNGVDTGALNDQHRTALRARTIGFVFQSFHLLPQRTALENVCIALLYSGVDRRSRSQRGLRALADVGLSHRADALSVHLSGGERQRVAIARALVSEPRLLLCDEPTGNLDSATAADVMLLIQRLHEQGHTVVLITHDADVARLAERRVRIQDGQLFTDERD